jgi:hypothetical protein
MRNFMNLDLKAPATMEAVLEAVVRLSAYDETQLLDLVSAGRLHEVFPFRPSKTDVIAPDFATENELIEASAFPLDRKERAALIQSSMPPSEESKVKVAKRVFGKLKSSSED